MQNSSTDNIKFDRKIFKKRAFCIASFYIYTPSMDSPLENLERKKIFWKRPFPGSGMDCLIYFKCLNY